MKNKASTPDLNFSIKQKARTISYSRDDELLYESESINVAAHFPIKSIDREAIEMKKELFEKMDSQCKLNVVVLEIEAMYCFIRERIGDEQC